MGCESLKGLHGADCERLTRPAAIGRALRLWLPNGSGARRVRVYVGSDEPPAFFEPLADRYR